MLDLVSSPFGLIAIGAFLCIGFVVGRLIESARRKVVAGGFCLAVPVFLAGLAYLSAGSDGCGGGDCGGGVRDSGMGWNGRSDARHRRRRHVREQRRRAPFP